MDKPSGSTSTAVVGRYSIHAEIAHGGMATVHVGRLMGPVGFSRTVAVKRLHSQYAKDPEFVAMFMDEARLAARVQHPNVVSIIDVVAESGELLLVMDYVQGESLSRLLRGERSQGTTVDPRIAVKIMTEVLSGLHAAHDARNERGNPLGIVHRDVSPQNVLVGVDGVAHLIDFGVAKASGRIQNTRDGQIKGKLAYMAPEQIRSTGVDRRTDIYAAAAVLWEMLAGRRLFTGDEANLMYAVLTVPIAAPSTVNPAVTPELDAVVMKGLQKNASKRYSTALEMADALEAVIPPASSREVARWMERLASKELDARAHLVAEVESISHHSTSPPGSGLIPAGDSSVSGAGQPAPAAPEGAPLESGSNGAARVASEIDGTPDTPTETSSSLSSAGIPGRTRNHGWWVATVIGATMMGGGAFWIARAKVMGSTAAITAESPVASASGLPEQSTPVVASAALVSSAAPTSTPAAATSASPANSGVPTAKSVRSPSAPVALPTAPTQPVGNKKKQTYTRD